MGQQQQQAIPTIKEYMVQKLRERNIEKFSTALRDKDQTVYEIQMLLIDYTNTYYEHFSKSYVYVYFDFGALMPQRLTELRGQV